MNDGDATTREALARQLATLEQLQRDVAQKLSEHADLQETAPTAPWLVRRGAANAPVTPRTLPPWLARRGR